MLSDDPVFWNDLNSFLDVVFDKISKSSVGVEEISRLNLLSWSAISQILLFSWFFFLSTSCLQDNRANEIASLQMCQVFFYMIGNLKNCFRFVKNSKNIFVRENFDVNISVRSCQGAIYHDYRYKKQIYTYRCAYT